MERAGVLNVLYTQCVPNTFKEVLFKISHKMLFHVVQMCWCCCKSLIDVWENLAVYLFSFLNIIFLTWRILYVTIAMMTNHWNYSAFVLFFQKYIPKLQIFLIKFNHQVKTLSLVNNKNNDIFLNHNNAIVFLSEYIFTVLYYLCVLFCSRSVWCSDVNSWLLIICIMNMCAWYL
jgi:hypothetical protein